MCHVNSALRIRHEQKKTQSVVERLDTYMPVDPVNDEVEKVSPILSLYFTCFFSPTRVQKKSRLHGCEPEEGFLNLCQF